MAKRPGRTVVLKVGTEAIAGMRVTGLKYDGTPIDITDADSVGLTTYLAGHSASKQLTIEASGIADSNLFRSKIVDPTTDMLLTNITYTDPGAVPGSDVLSGNFYMTSYAENGTYDGAVEFSATFVSSGAWLGA